MKNSVFLWIALLAVCFVPVYGDFIGGAGAFDFGVLSLRDFKNVNSELMDRYDKDLGEEMLMLGGHGYAQFDFLVFGGEGYGILNYYNASYTRPNSLFPDGEERGSLGMESGYGALNIGIDSGLSESIKVIPMAVIGYGGMCVTANPVYSGYYAPDWEDKDNSRVATQGCFVVGGKVLSEMRFNLVHRANHQGGLLVGLVAGWNQWMLPTRWAANHRDLEDLPEGTLSGPYVMISIGGFGGESTDSGIKPYKKK